MIYIIIVFALAAINIPFIEHTFNAIALAICLGIRSAMIIERIINP